MGLALSAFLYRSIYLSKVSRVRVRLRVRVRVGVSVKVS